VEKQYATVTFFERGWGFAELDSNRTSLYLHHSDIASRVVLHSGDKIACTVEPSGHPKNPFRGRNIELVRPDSEAVSQ
jgi:cold shock CspA family protein